MSIEIHLPEGLKISPFELNMLLAAKLFEEGLHFRTRGRNGRIVQTGLY